MVDIWKGKVRSQLRHKKPKNESTSLSSLEMKCLTDLFKQVSSDTAYGSGSWVTHHLTQGGLGR